MITDAHIHLLPGIDDGSDSPETTANMMAMLKKQGVSQILATPHFYAHREGSVKKFLEKRNAAYEAIDAPDNIRLGAEVAIEHGISKMDGIASLAYQNSDLILLEFPYTGYSSWMGEEVYNISAEYKLKPVIAHIHRYLDFYSKAQMEQILSMKVIFQINNEAFSFFRQRRFVKRLIKEGYPVIFGSDSHNCDTRKPNWDVLKRKVKAPVIEESMALLESHFR